MLRLKDTLANGKRADFVELNANPLEEIRNMRMIDSRGLPQPVLRACTQPAPDGSQPIHELVLVAMGMAIFDNCDLEQLGKEAEKRRRWEFLITAAPAAVPNASGSVLNPIATF